MSDQPRRNQPSEVDVRLDIDGTEKAKLIRINDVIHNQFAAPGVWLRGTLHCHVDRPGNPAWKDQALDHYRALGYHFIAGMDHEKIVPLESRPDMLVIPGAEIGAPRHLLAYGIQEIPQASAETGAIPRTAHMIRQVKDAGGVVVLAHPFWQGFTAEELTALCDAGLDGLEIVNSPLCAAAGDTGRSDQLWRQLLRQGRFLAAFGGDDAHGPRKYAPGKRPVPPDGWTGVLAEDFSVPAVLEAMRQGRTYASEGPEFRGIEFRRDGTVVVSCSPCVACHFRSVGAHLGGRSVFAPDDQETSERLVLDWAHEGYRILKQVVIILEDQYGRRAWLSPIRIDVHRRGR